jgi:hypothetical protein
MVEAQQLADRYVAAWNETDSERRRRAIEGLWVTHGEHYVDTRHAVGYDALETRIRGSHEKNVTNSGNIFRTVQDARQLHNVVIFHWQMLPAGGEEILATGLEFLVVGDDGRIVTDYQFIV